MSFLLTVFCSHLPFLHVRCKRGAPFPFCCYPPAEERHTGKGRGDRRGACEAKIIYLLSVITVHLQCVFTVGGGKEPGVLTTFWERSDKDLTQTAWKPEQQHVWVARKSVFLSPTVQCHTWGTTWCHYEQQPFLHAPAFLTGLMRG